MSERESEREEKKEREREEKKVRVREGEGERDMRRNSPLAYVASSIAKEYSFLYWFLCGFTTLMW